MIRQPNLARDQIFEWHPYGVDGGQVMYWDVTTAQEHVRLGHIAATVVLGRAELEEVNKNNETNEAHLERVDPSIPGIGAPVERNGEVGYILIDGNHRAVRAFRDGGTFTVNLLTDEAAIDCQMSRTRTVARVRLNGPGPNISESKSEGETVSDRNPGTGR